MKTTDISEKKRPESSNNNFAIHQLQATCGLCIITKHI